MAAFVSPGAVSGVGASRPQPQPPGPVVLITGPGKSTPPQRAAGLDVPGILAAVACGSLIVVIAASFTGVIGASAAAPVTLAARMPPALGTRAGIDVLLIALFVAAGSAALTMSLRQRESALFGRLTSRAVLGLACLVGADALIVALFGTSASQQLGRLLALMASVALLGPALVAAAGPALAGARARPRPGRHLGQPARLRPRRHRGQPAAGAAGRAGSPGGRDRHPCTSPAGPATGRG
jgi:hypothetical protein